MYFLQVSQDKGMEAEPVVDARQPGQRREERCVRRSGCFWQRLNLDLHSLWLLSSPAFFRLQVQCSLRQFVASSRL
jgi:hypothetical protein